MPEEINKLVEASQQGDRRAYEQLVTLFIPQVQFAVYNIVRDTHLAEDITQEAFVKAWLALSGLKNPDKFPAWLMEISRNTAKDVLKKRKVPMVSLETFENTVSSPAPVQSNEHLMEKIRQLPDDYQDLLMLRYFEDLSYKQIAGRLSMNISAVGEKLCRIRQMLRSIERRT